MRKSASVFSVVSKILLFDVPHVHIAGPSGYDTDHHVWHDENED
jgi:hypothetical protein